MKHYSVRFLGAGLASLLVTACGQEASLGSGPNVEVAPPPGEEDDEGDPPAWDSCFQGYRGIYSNLKVSHEHVDPRPMEPPAPTDPAQLDWWDEPSYEDFDPTLDFGQNWWPVDEGLEGDPAYFAVRWEAWIRAYSNTTLEFTLGSADDSWVIVNGTPIASKPGIQEYERETFSVSLDAGQYPLEILYAHRQDGSGFSFRVLSGDVKICYPEYGSTEDGG
jgi:hypothetical protein